MTVNQSVNKINLLRQGQIPDIQKSTCMDMHVNIKAEMQGILAKYTTTFFFNLMSWLSLKDTHHIHKSPQDTD